MHAVRVHTISPEARHTHVLHPSPAGKDTSSSWKTPSTQQPGPLPLDPPLALDAPLAPEPPAPPDAPAPPELVPPVPASSCRSDRAPQAALSASSTAQAKEPLGRSCLATMESAFHHPHPGGSLGRKLTLRVADIMLTEDIPSLGPDATMRSCIVMLAGKRGTGSTWTLKLPRLPRGRATISIVAIDRSGRVQQRPTKLRFRVR